MQWGIQGIPDCKDKLGGNMRNLLAWAVAEEGD